MLTSYIDFLLNPPTYYGVKFMIFSIYRYFSTFLISLTLINIYSPTLILIKVFFINKDNPLYTILYNIIKGKPLR